MSATIVGSGPGAPPAADDPARIFARPPTTGLARHVRRHGPLPAVGADLIAEVERAGLRGRGGARFPTARKLAAVAAGGRSIVVANGCEGEPASAKDRTLLRLAPHLVLDGAALAAAAVGATRVLLCIERGQPALAAGVRAALAERRDAVAVTLHESPPRYLAGEESALVHWLNGGEAKPTSVPPRPFERGVDRRPTLVDNVETLAQLALVARHGAAWYRRLGTAEDPGTFLMTLGGAVARPGVYEVPGGSPLAGVLAAAGGGIAGTQAVLVGGYFGTWVPAATAAALTVDAASLATAGAGLGCGVLVALPHGACGLAESARVTRWLADQNAGQCGPCVHGLGALARGMDRLVAGRASRRTGRDIGHLSALVAGRGACRHPDGAVRFVTSALRVFGPHADDHERHGPCPARPPLLPTPTPALALTPDGGWR
jgi:NADH:ubiquinone oxidoreductase subunit F (NADH-binding)